MSNNHSEGLRSPEKPARKPSREMFGKILTLGIVASPIIAGMVRSGFRGPLHMSQKNTIGDPRNEPRTPSGETDRKTLQNAYKADNRVEEPQLTPEDSPSPLMPAAIREGWHRPSPERVPLPTYSPPTVAVGIVAMLWGTVTTPVITVIGLLVFAVGLVSWVGGLRHER